TAGGKAPMTGGRTPERGGGREPFDAALLDREEAGAAGGERRREDLGLAGGVGAGERRAGREGGRRWQRHRRQGHRRAEAAGRQGPEGEKPGESCPARISATSHATLMAGRRALDRR